MVVFLWWPEGSGCRLALQRGVGKRGMFGRWIGQDPCVWTGMQRDGEASGRKVWDTWMSKVRDKNTG